LTVVLLVAVLSIVYHNQVDNSELVWSSCDLAIVTVAQKAYDACHCDAVVL